MPATLRIGVSACLLGEEVRYDGGHKRDAWIADLLGRFVEFVPVCPEVEFGLGTPREPIRLEKRGAGVALVAPRRGEDLTERMAAYSARRAAAIAKLDLDGYLLKSKSPTCGMERVKVWDANGVPARTGRGLFAEALIDRLPQLPVEEEGRLNDPAIRENFIERIFANRRLKDFFSGRWTIGGLVAFHSNEKLLLMAHDPGTYKALGPLVAGAKKLDRPTLESRYRGLFLAGLARPATVRRHVNVLQHMAGYFKKCADPGDREELARLVADYRAGLLPLVVPITLLRHLVRRHDVRYLAGQTYLEPHPKELMLRNHV